MGYVLGPQPLSEEEVDRRVAAGARTFQEIDPEYWAHHQSQMRFYRWASVAMVIALGVMLAALVMAASLSTWRRYSLQTLAITGPENISRNEAPGG